VKAGQPEALYPARTRAGRRGSIRRPVNPPRQILMGAVNMLTMDVGGCGGSSA